MIVWLNYALIAQFAILAVGWYASGDRMQALYWVGAVICTAGATLGK